jgi:hypothetical protein
VLASRPSSVTFLKLETFSDELIWPDSKVIYPTEWSSYLKIVTLVTKKKQNGLVCS